MNIIIDTSALSIAIGDFSNIVSSIKNVTGADVYLVGGCVRDTVMGLEPKDYDLASAATPEQIIDVVDDLAENSIEYCNNIRTEPTGIDHGTVSIIYNVVPFEHTTFRKDVATDGRRAVVEFASGEVADNDTVRLYFETMGYSITENYPIDELIKVFRSMPR